MAKSSFFMARAAWVDEEIIPPEAQYLLDTYLERMALTVAVGAGAAPLLPALQRRGFCRLHLLDRMPSMTGEISDAILLRYPDAHFSQLLYWQQDADRPEARDEQRKLLREAFRILGTNGAALFSAPCIAAEQPESAGHGWLAYLQCLPSLRQGRMHRDYHLGGGTPVPEARIARYCRQVQEAGFHIEAIATDHQLRRRMLVHDLEILANDGIDGRLYLVARKR